MSNKPPIDEVLTELGVGSDLALVLRAIANACAEIAATLRTGELDAHQGGMARINVQGEEQKEMDIIAHDIFEGRLAATGEVAAMVSEEVNDIIHVPGVDSASLLVAFDPLDGSSNIALNMSVGSIFSVRRAGADVAQTFLTPGAEQLAAGYAIYGPSTMLVLAVADSLIAFALDPRDDQFYRLNERFTIPSRAREFAINMSRYHLWEPPVRDYVEACIADGPERYNMRWIASMVAEVHRIVTRGGVFLYPLDRDNCEKGGRLRWLYEACPMALIVEAAGGAASTGRGRILDLYASGIHQRVPVLLGAREDVRDIEQAHVR